VQAMIMMLSVCCQVKFNMIASTVNPSRIRLVRVFGIADFKEEPAVWYLPVVKFEMEML
jgi:hypothetical protein